MGNWHNLCEEIGVCGCVLERKERRRKEKTGRKERREGKKRRGGLIQDQVWLVGRWGWFRDEGFFHEGLRRPGEGGQML